MLRSFNQSGSGKYDRDPAAESDYSVEFKSGYTDPYSAGSLIETSGPLWGPGIRVQQTPSLTSQKLAHWREYGQQPESRNAEAELDKLYASLPEEAFEITLKDLVEGRKASPKGSQRLTSAKGGESMTIGAILGRKSPKEVSKGAAREDGGKFKPKNKVHNSPTYSLPFKIPQLSPKREKSPPAFPRQSPERLSLSSHFRAEEAGTSPRNFQKEHPPSFSEFKIDSYSSESELARAIPAGLRLHDTRGSQSPRYSLVDPRTLREQLSQAPETKAPIQPVSAPQANECSTCSASSLFFKTRCMVCGKTYCYKCVRTSMVKMPDGRRCMSTCRGRPANPKFVKKSGLGCWPLFGFSNNHAIVVENVNGNQNASRYQDKDMQRKFSSYPPPRLSNQQASPRMTTEIPAPRPTSPRVPPRQSPQHPQSFGAATSWVVSS